MAIVCCLGDSITDGYPSNYGGWRAHLLDAMRTLGKPITYVGTLETPNRPDLPHEGHDGFQVGQLWSYVNNGGIDNLLPDVFLLEIGVNDATKLPAGKSRQDFAALIALLHTKFPTARVVATLPEGSPAWESQQGVGSAMNYIRLGQGIVATGQSGWPLNLLQKDGLSDDLFASHGDVHPSPLGYLHKSGPRAEHLYSVL